MFTSPTEIQRPGLVFSFLKKYMPSEDTVEEVKRMSLTADGKSAVFDVPSKLAQVSREPGIERMCFVMIKFASAVSGVVLRSREPQWC